MSHDTRKKGLNIEFWADQIFTLIATVVGVYLAANSGFNKALEFDSLQRERDSYHIQSALYSEFKTNLDSLKVWTETFNKNPRSNGMHYEKDKYQFSFFLWETMQESSTIFAIPYNRVEVIASFYDKARHLREVIFSGNPFESPQAAKKLVELEQSIRSDFLVDFKKGLTEMKDDLESNSLSI